MFREIAFDAGVHLRGTPLWFDPLRSKPLAVVTSLRKGWPPAHARMVASAELVAMLAAHRPARDALPLPLDRWVGVGGRELKLVAASEQGVGACHALVAADSHLHLVAGRLCTGDRLWPKVDHLVMEVPALRHQGELLGDALPRLAHEARAAQRQGLRAAVVADNLGLGVAVVAGLGELGLQVSPSGVLAEVAGTGRRRDGVRISLAPPTDRSRTRTVWLDSGLGTVGAGPARASRAESAEVIVPVRWYATSETVEVAVRETGARAVTLVGVAEPQAAEIGARFPAVDVRGLAVSSQLDLSATN